MVRTVASRLAARFALLVPLALLPSLLALSCSAKKEHPKPSDESEKQPANAGVLLPDAAVLLPDGAIAQTKILLENLNPVHTLAVDSTHVYAAQRDHATFRISKQGGIGSDIGPGVAQLVVDGDTIFAIRPSSQLIRFPTKGGAVDELADSTWTENGRAIAVDATHVYGYWFPGQEIFRVDKVTLTRTPVVAKVESASSLAIVGDTLYFVADAQAGAPGVFSVKKTGGAVTRIAAANYWPSAIVTSKDELYWSDEPTKEGRESRSLRAVKLGGGGERFVTFGMAPWLTGLEDRLYFSTFPLVDGLDTFTGERWHAMRVPYTDCCDINALAIDETFVFAAATNLVVIEGSDPPEKALRSYLVRLPR